VLARKVSIMEARIGALIGLENHEGLVIGRGGSIPSVSA
jgi:hypothetical protein